MLKELKSYITICDSCGLEKNESSQVLSQSSFISFRRLLGHDFCENCFSGLVDALVSERFITQENLEEVLETFTPPSRKFTQPTTVTFLQGGKCE